MRNNNSPDLNKLLAANNYYETLGISKNASNTQIKKAYRQKALIYHPDKNDLPQAKLAFTKISTAYQALSNQTQRKIYDEKISQKSNFSFKQNHMPKHSTSQNIPKFKFNNARNFERQKQFKPKPSPSKKFNFDDPKQAQNRKAETSSHFEGSRDKPRYKSNLSYRKTSSNAAAFITLLIFLFVWYMMPNFSRKPQFLLAQSGTYNIKLQTKQLKVSYYIESTHDLEAKPISQQIVQRLYLRKLQKECQNSLNQKKTYQKLASRSTLDHQRERFIDLAGNVNLKTCKKIIKILKKHPYIKLSTFSNNISDL